MKISGIVLKKINLELLLEIFSLSFLIELIFSSGTNYKNWNVLTTKELPHLEMCCARPRRIICRLFCRRNKWLILGKSKFFVHFLFFWCVRCPKVELFIKKKCLRMRYLKRLLTMTVIKKISRIFWKHLNVPIKSNDKLMLFCHSCF